MRAQTQIMQITKNGSRAESALGFRRNPPMIEVIPTPTLLKNKQVMNRPSTDRSNNSENNKDEEDKLEPSRSF